MHVEDMFVEGYGCLGKEDGREGGREEREIILL